VNLAHRIARGAGLAALVIASLATAAKADVPIAAVIEAKGGGLIAGTSYRNGYRMAIDEINASGGILGQQVKLKEIEIDTNGDAAKAATKEALAGKPFALLGPVFSGLTLASYSVSRDSGVPQFSGGEASSISRQFPATLYRTSLSQRASLPRLASFLTYALQAKKVAVVWVDNEFGRDGRDALLQVLPRFGAAGGESIGVKAGEQDFKATVDKLMAADFDALVIYMNEGESPALLQALKARNFSKPIIGDGPLVAQTVIDKAGAAAEGVYAHLAITTEAPNARVRSFVERYGKRYNSKPDHNAIKGYFAVQVIKSVSERVGKLDQAAFNEAMKSVRIEASQSPAMLTSAAYFAYGDMTRESYFAQVRNGSLVVLATVPMSDGTLVDLPGGKTVHLNSREGRAQLLGEAATAAAKPATPKKTGT